MIAVDRHPAPPGQDVQCSPHRDENTTCTTVAPDLAFADPSLVRKFSFHGQRSTRSQDRAISGRWISSLVRSQELERAAMKASCSGVSTASAQYLDRTQATASRAERPARTARQANAVPVRP